MNRYFPTLNISTFVLLYYTTLLFHSLGLIYFFVCVFEIRPFIPTRLAAIDGDDGYTSTQYKAVSVGNSGAI